MADDFIDIHNLDRYFQNKVEKIKKDKELSDKNKQIILDYLRDSELGKTIKKGQKKKIGSGRNIHAATILNKMAKEWFEGKELDKITQQDMEKFILGLDKGIILSNKGGPYASEAKSNIKKFIKKFYKYILTNGKHFPDLVDWIDTTAKESEIEAVPGLYDGIWKIVELIPDVRRKALVWVTFDSGFREGEIINTRIKDIEKNEDGIYYITCRHSKTKPRTVSLPYSSKLLDRWLQEHPKKDDPDAQLWQTSRVMLYKTVKRYGRKAHKRNITVHMLRHTSATFWASKLDRVNLCKKFGWSYSSRVPDRYIDFAKIGEGKIIDIVKAEKYTELAKKMEEQRIQNLSLKEEMQEMRKTMEALSNKQKHDALKGAAPSL